MPKIVVIAGPTASGKSDLAIKLAKKYNGIIINADSRQIYRDLNLSTAKPVPEKISKDGTWFVDGVPHYLYNFVALDSDYNIYKYQNDVKKIIESNSDKVIFLVGGTGLYIDSIIHGYILPKHKSENFERFNIEELKNMIGKKISFLNPSDRENPRRLISLLRREEEPKSEISSNYLYLVIDVPKEILKERIAKRVNKMIDEGLVDENRTIFEKYGELNLPSLNTIGYKEFEEYFKNNISLEEAISLVVLHTMQYVKRQKTWFKRNKETVYINDFNQADQATSNFLRN